MAYLRRYGVATTINFDLFEVDGVDFRVDAVHASGDTKIMKDEGAEANTTNGFTDEGQGYSLALTATEMQAARIVIYVVDQTATKVWLDRTIIIETYANASAEHPFIGEGVWDRALTGATHNIATSAGRRLRGIQEFQGYENGSIWIDTVNGTAGTVDYENGTVENPVASLADALTLATSLNMTRFTVINGSTITLTTTTSNKVFFGDRWTLALGGQDVSGSHFEGADVSGIGTGTEFHFENCDIGTVTLSTFHATNCRLSGTITFSAAGSYYLANCHSGIAGTSSPVIDTGVAVANVNLNVRAYSGGIDLRNLGQAGTDNASIEGFGQVILNANCVGGTVAIRGLFELTNNGSGMTIADEPRYDSDTLIDLNWDEVITSGAHNVNNSAAKILRELRENPGYEGGFIYIDTVNGTAGTENYVNGTLDNPVDSIADANTLAAALGISRFKVISGSSITFVASQENQEFWGESWTLALGGQSISGTFIHGADVSGVGTGAVKPKFEHCDVNGVTVPPCTMYLCGFSGDIVLGGAGNYFWYDCHSEVAGVTTPSIDVGAAIGDTNVNLRKYAGGMEFKNLGQLGTDNVSVEGDGNVILNPNCVGGTIAIRGNLTLEDNSATTTVSDDARIDKSQVAAGVLDEATSGHTTVGTVGEVLNNQQRAVTAGAAIAGTLSVTQMTTDLTESTDDHYNGQIIKWTTGALKGQATDVTDYTGSTKLLTFTQVTEAPSAGDEFIIV